MSNYDDVFEFNEKFDMLRGTKPRHLTKRKLKERAEFLLEELLEFTEASGLSLQCEHTGEDITKQFSFEPSCDKPSVELQADALVDLVYVAMGTAVMMGLPWQQLWDDVHRANMSKVLGATKRGHRKDCMKPEGWIGPDGESILFDYGYDPAAEEVDDEL